MPTRQLSDQPPQTARPDPGDPQAPAASRDPVLLGDVLFHTLADLARRTAAPSLPAQRTRPHP
ncbi:hypothetical protein ACIQOW_27165 [Kitasatospora sp. NPDC091335]|uniref:hypothetical protein n=1 Tax=Streptomycetaceae TaxID=2062 RepID=UPI001661D182|nr:hypothetical protein [Streptomyces sp. CBMA156]MBD0674097.1 hypothetical protein [Streptomyces sp. CBMA156]